MPPYSRRCWRSAHCWRGLCCGNAAGWPKVSWGSVRSSWHFAPFWPYPALRRWPLFGISAPHSAGWGPAWHAPLNIEDSMTALGVIIACGLLAIVYGIWAIWSVLQADAGSARMQEIAAAVREGAQAYLKRQYPTIAMVGIVIFVIVGYLLGWLVGIGFLIRRRHPRNAASSTRYAPRPARA